MKFDCKYEFWPWIWNLTMKILNLRMDMRKVRMKIIYTIWPWIPLIILSALEFHMQVGTSNPTNCHTTPRDHVQLHLPFASGKHLWTHLHCHLQCGTALSNTLFTWIQKCPAGTCIHICITIQVRLAAIRLAGYMGWCRVLQSSLLVYFAGLPLPSVHLSVFLYNHFLILVCFLFMSLCSVVGLPAK